MPRHFSIAAILLLSLGLSACGIAPYKQPAEGQPYALLKLKYSYNAVSNGTSMGSRLYISHGKADSKKFKVAYNKTHGTVNEGAVNPDIPVDAVKIIPGQNTDAQMAVYFFWYTTQTFTTFVNGVPMVQTQQVYNENTCTVELNFQPEAGKEYLLDYTSTSVNKDCTAAAYEKQNKKAGGFKLKPVGSSKTV